ncbi:Translation initiation factor 3 subunit b [Ascosphaera pollenicola]|nr:Translation initiation factor 3 subunit b [Ascosphaera pollenicola]
MQFATSSIVSPETKQRYTIIIDGILAHSDINLVSAKRIRRELQDAVGEDLSSQKDAIKELIMQRFDLFVAAEEDDAVKTETPPPDSDADAGADAEGEVGADVDAPSSAQKRTATDDDDDDSEQPSKKRRQTSMESDAALAARLQAEENLTRRQTRGAGSRKATTPKKKIKKVKSAAKAKIGDNAVGGEDAPKKTTGFHMSRPQIVKKLWEYIRANDLQDPADRRQIRCDDQMKAVFKQDRIHMFTLNKLLAQNLHDVEQ